MFGRLTLVLALFAGLFGVGMATPSQAQIAGRWTFPYGQSWLEVDNRVGVNGLTPPWIQAGMNDETGGTFSYYGNYRNLVWEGRWYFFGDSPPSGIAFRPCAQPHGDRYRRPTNRYGRFRVTFNAAENRFEGVMSNCNIEPIAGRGSQAFVGTRNNTITFSGEAPPAREPRDISPSVPGSLPTALPREDYEAAQAARADAASERACVALRDDLDVAWSAGFSTHPCIYNIGDEVEIITRTDQTQRPVSVIYRAFHAGRDGIPRYLRISSRRGLPNQGLPRAGHRYRISFGGDICREANWMLSILMSDGTETGPIGMVVTGDEEVPLFRRSCNPGPHPHESSDFLNPGVPQAARELIPLVPSPGDR